MEEGSLLQEALSGGGGDSRALAATRCALVVDAYLLPLPSTGDGSLLNGGGSSTSSSSSRARYLLELASIGNDLNAYVGSRGYPWLQGGDGPVFGVHLTRASSSTLTGAAVGGAAAFVPHLRCVCHYGVSVQDEWKLVATVLEFSRNRPYSCAASSSSRLAFECWDEDDGQLLLIEGATALPDWVDELGPRRCRRRCWVVDGQVHLVEPSPSSGGEGTDHAVAGKNAPLTLEGALQLIGAQSPLVKADADVTAVIWETLRRRRVLSDDDDDGGGAKESGCVGDEKSLRLLKQQQNEKDRSHQRQRHYYHRAAVAVPRAAALLMSDRPDLVAAACRAFVEHAPDHDLLWRERQRARRKNTKKSAAANDGNGAADLAGTWCEDWVWTRHDFGRSQYAALRNFVTSPPWHRSEDAPVPSHYNSIEVRRIKRQCAVESAPHLRHALQLGVRLVAGLDYLLLLSSRQEVEEGEFQPAMGSMNHTERRVLEYWTSIDRALSLRGGGAVVSADGESWLSGAWQAGPNRSSYDLEPILKCPVYDPEVSACETPLSHPRESLASQVRRELLRGSRGTPEEGTANLSHPPGPSEVDEDGWMTMPDEEEVRKLTSPVELKTVKDRKLAESNAQDYANDDVDGSKVLDEMLGGVHSFMKGQSMVEGVETVKSTKTEPSNTISNDSVHSRQITINPTVFLNILHSTLKARTVDELNFPTQDQQQLQHVSSDPFFSEGDYDMREDDDSDETVGAEDTVITELMNAMDQELLQSSQGLSRTLDDANATTLGEHTDVAVSWEEATESAHVLSNLLHSLDAGAGGPGPVQNILKEMGIHPPDLAPPDKEGDNNDTEQA